MGTWIRLTCPQKLKRTQRCYPLAKKMMILLLMQGKS